MNRSSRRTLTAILIVLLAVPTGMAMATPYFRIDTKLDWDTANASGRIQAVPAGTFEGMVLGDPAWPPEYQGATFFTPELYVMDSGLDGEPGLVMAWGPPAQLPADTRMAAAWDFVYDLDPSLSGAIIEFSIFPPVVSTLFSLNLIDGNNNYREWIWHAGGPGELPAFQWSDLQIDPVTGWSNWPTFVPVFTHDPDPAFPFDLSSITILRFDENITGGFSNFFPPPEGPGAGGVQPFWVWNAWDHVAVTEVPEPTTMLLLGGGLLVLARRRRRAK